ncbi:TetR family transcriptional regulator [Kitasatospora sp. NPDC093550]|uniref:TetR family transcriptional regulator n=1 Tax=Kitasatospora sp. NPDC093550 TaxID=3364089 RepID=UPI0038103EAF
MTKQDRAQRTRAALIETAAGEFAREGYAGAALSRISKAAGTSVGAVTFHFDSKADLASAVVDRAVEAGRAVVDRAAATEGPPLRRLTAVVLGLARAADADVAVRCAARLERDDAVGDAGRWRETWWPVVRRLAQEAHQGGDLPGAVSPGGTADLAALFIRSIGMHVEGSDDPGRADGGSGAAHLARLWQITQPGMADRGPGED